MTTENIRGTGELSQDDNEGRKRTKGGSTLQNKRLNCDAGKQKQSSVITQTIC